MPGQKQTPVKRLNIMYKNINYKNKYPPKNIHTLIKEFFEFVYNNPERIEPGHGSLYFWILERNNSLFWKPVFGLPTSQAMRMVGIKCPKYYRRIRSDLIEWGFIKVVNQSKNQYDAIQISVPYRSELDKMNGNTQLDFYDRNARDIQEQKNQAMLELEKYRSNGIESRDDQGRIWDPDQDEGSIPMEPVYQGSDLD